MEALSAESGIIRAMVNGEDDAVDNPIDGSMFIAHNETGGDVDGAKALPKARDVIRSMGERAAAKHRSGALARTKKEMARAGNVAVR